MTIELKPEQQRVIDLAVQSGAYQNPDEVLEQAFALIREQLDLEDLLEQRDAVVAHIEFRDFSPVAEEKSPDFRCVRLTMLRTTTLTVAAPEIAGMNAPFHLTPQAIEDLDVIWWFIAERSRDAANRVEMEIRHYLFQRNTG